ncbi:hypothetical protein OOC_18072 [Providencia rettgeri Dmel1]|nr:hypothetical protein OOC_18072 [Providencia rettgeri Dmel1]
MLNKKKSKTAILAILTILLVTSSLYTYDNINTPTLPNCEATLKINISDNRSDLKGFYLLSVLPNQKNLGKALLS